MAFIDRPRVLGRGEVGSSNLATNAAYRQKLAPSSVGTVAQGTLTAAKIVGTIGQLDIGSYTVSYGSGGTLVGRMVRGGYGSFVGTVRSRMVRAPFGSFGTSAGRLHRAGQGSYGTTGGAYTRAARGSYGTLGGAFFHARYGSFSGTIEAPVHFGRVGSFVRTTGTINLQARGYGTLLNPRIGTIPAGKVSSGTLTTPRIPLLSSLAGTTSGKNIGTFGVGKVSYGTLAAPRHQLLQNIPGTLAPASLKVGTISASRVTHGTLNRPSAGGNYGSYGTVAARVARASLGSFSRVWASGSVASNNGSFKKVHVYTYNYVGTPGTIGLVHQGYGSIYYVRRLAGTSHALIPPNPGSFSLGNAANPLGSIVHQLGSIKGQSYARRGSYGTTMGRVTRYSYGSFGTTSSRIMQAAVGSHGTLRTQYTRGRYGSFGTTSGRIMRAGVGSFTSALSGFTRAPFGSFGTLTTHIARGLYGSFGTVTGRIVRTGVGSFGGAGTTTISRLQVTRFWGTERLLVPTGAGSNRPPPSRLRRLSVEVTLTATTTGNAAYAIRQSRRIRGGTLARVVDGALTAAQAHNVLCEAWILPNYGSYREGSVSSTGGATISVVSAREIDM